MSRDAQDRVLARLCQLIQAEPALRQDQDALRQRLSAECADCADQVASVVLLIENGIVSRIDALPSATPYELAIGDWMSQIKDRQADMDEGVARWSIECWAAALGIDLRRRLQAAVRQDQNVVDDPQACHDQLRDVCPNLPHLKQLLNRAIELKIVKDLANLPRHAPHDWLVPILVERLQQGIEHPRETCRWAVESWVAAIGRKLPADSDRRVPWILSSRTFDTTVGALGGALFGMSIFSILVGLDRPGTCAIGGAVVCGAGGLAGGLVGGLFAATNSLKASCWSGTVCGVTCGALLGGSLGSFGLLFPNVTGPILGMMIGATVCGLWGRQIGKGKIIGGAACGAVLLIYGLCVVDWRTAYDPEIEDWWFSELAGVFIWFLLLQFSFGVLQGYILGKFSAERVGRRKGYRIFKGHVGPVTAVALSPGGSQIVSCSAEPAGFWGAYYSFVYDKRPRPARAEGNSIRIWDRQTEREIACLRGHRASVNDVAFCPNGDQVASASNDVTIRIWDIANAAQLRKLDGHWRAVNRLAYSSDGSVIASCSADRTVRVWDADSGAERFRFEGHTSSVLDVDFHPSDHERIASCGEDGTVRLWRIGQAAPLRTIRFPNTNARQLAYAPDGERMLIGMDNAVLVIDGQTGNEKARFEFTGVTNSLVWSPDGALIAIAHGSRISLWDPAANKRQDLDGSPSAIANSMAMIQDHEGLMLVTGNDDRTIRLRRCDLNLVAVPTPTSDPAEINAAVAEADKSNRVETELRGEPGILWRSVAGSLLAGVLWFGWALAGGVAGGFVAALATILGYFFWTQGIETGSLIGAYVGVVPSLIIAAVWMSNEWSASVIKPRAWGGTLRGSTAGCATTIAVFAIVIVLRMLLVPALFELLSFLALSVLFGTLAGAFLGWCVGALSGVYCVVRRRMAGSKDHASYVAMFKPSELNEKRSAFVTRAKWSRFAIVAIIAFAAFMHGTLIISALLDDSGTKSGRGRNSGSMLRTMQSMLGYAPRYADFVPINNIVQDYIESSEQADDEYLNREFGFQGVLIDPKKGDPKYRRALPFPFPLSWGDRRPTSGTWTLGESVVPQTLAVCDFGYSSLDMLDYWDAKRMVKVGMHVYMSGKCQGIDAQNHVRFTECIVRGQTFPDD